MNRKEKDTLEFWELAKELKKWFEEREITLGYTDTHLGQLAIWVQRKLKEAEQKGIDKGKNK